ncbi:MAG TPA: P22 phage major capsid protein family protein [Acidobacteriaceae bacterium]
MAYITNEALVVLENELIIANRVERQYSDEFAQTGAKIGAICNIRRPPRYKGTYGPPLNVEDTFEQSIPVALNYQFHVDVQFTTQDLALSMDMFKKRILRPQIATVANRVDSDTAQYAYLNTAISVGTPGVSPNSLKLFTDARAILAAEACPREGEKNAVLDPISMSSMVATVQGLFNPQAKISEYIDAGMIAKEFAGLDWWEDQNIPVFQTGAQGGTPVLTTPIAGTAFLTSGWAQSGTVSTQGWTASTAVITVGDIIQFAGVFPVNPQNRLQYGKTLRQFVVLPPGGFVTPPNGAAAPGLTFGSATLAAGTFNPVTGQYTSSGTGTLTLTIGDCCISAGQFQNVTAAPASGATITVNGGTGNANQTSPQSLVFHKYAYALAFADLPLPRGVEFAARAFDDEDVGMSIRVVTQYTINNDSEPTRADVLYGPASIYRTLGIRVNG